MNYIYCRISTENQNETSFEVQEEVVRRQLLSIVDASSELQYNIEVVHEVGSGKDTEGRPKFLEMLNKLQAGDIVAIYDNSRLSRNTEISLFLLREITNKGARLLCDGKFISPDKPGDFMIFSIQSAFSTYQRQIQNQKSLEGIKKKYSNGDAVFTSRLTGYSITKKGKVVKAEIIEDEAKVIRYIYQRVAAGITIKKVAKEIYLTSTQRNIVYDVQFVNRTLRKPIYMGYYAAEKETNRHFLKYSKEELKANLIKSNIYPPIVDENLWWDCYDIWASRGQKRRTYRLTEHELSGIYHCPSCGKGIVYGAAVEYGYDKIKTTYAVRQHAPNCTETRFCYGSEWLEKINRALFFIVFFYGNEVGSFFDEQKDKLYQSNKELEEAVDSVKRVIDSIQKKKDNIINAIADGIITTSDAKDKLNTINSEMNKYTEQMNSLLSEIHKNNMDADDLIEEASADVLKKFDNSRKVYYMKYVKEGLVYKDHLTISYFNGKEFWYSRPKRYNNGVADTMIKVSYKGEEQFTCKYIFKENKIVVDKYESDDQWVNTAVNIFYKDLERFVNDHLNG